MPGGSITFRQREGFWDLPPATVPCGQCIGCRLERSRQWAVRCVHESKMHKQNCFLTLTYDNEHLPPRGLDVTHWQKFAKRLRKYQANEHLVDSTKPKSFRFFHCGEYGEHTNREHLHALIFGLDFHEDRKHFKNSGQFPLYRSATLDKLWGNGYVNIGELSFETAAYCARYTTTKITGQLAETHYQRVDTATGEIYQIKPPYCTMSRRPGIGKPWLDKFKTDVYPSDEVISNGKPAKPPKYYDNQLEEDELLFIKTRRLEKSSSIKFRKELTPQRLAVRHRIATHRQEQASRNKIETHD